MKRFVYFFNLLPGRIKTIDWVIDNFDFIMVGSDISNFKDYEAIFIYGTWGGAGRIAERLFGTIDKIPEYLRKHGITKPKILYQQDYYGGKPHEFRPTNVFPHVDGIMHANFKQWDHLKKPAFYVQFPVPCPKEYKWKEFDDKKNGVTIKRHYGSWKPSERIANGIGIELHALGGDVPKRYGGEYLEYLSEHKMGIDYHENYWGWSRFVAEATCVGTPVIGPPTTMGVGICNPILTGDNEYLVDIGKRLNTDKEFYEEARKISYENMMKHLSQEECAKRYINILRAIGIDI